MEERLSEERLRLLFELTQLRIGKLEQEMRKESERLIKTVEYELNDKIEKQRVESEKIRVEMKAEIIMEVEKQMRLEMESLRSVAARHEFENTKLKIDNAQLKIDNAILTTDLTEIHNDLPILHPLSNARLHLHKCIKHQNSCHDAVNAFIDRYSLEVINSTPSLSSQLHELKIELKKAWDARFAAAHLCEPRPTLESILWIVAKSGFTREVAPLINLSKATRECKNLQREMKEVRNWGRWGGGKTQLHYYCENGMTTSVARMLEMRSIDVEAKRGDGWTCLMTASWNGHLDICRLLIDNGAQLEAKDSDGRTPLHCAASRGHVEIVRLLCDRGADVQARDDSGSTPLHFAARCYHISVVEELVVERNVDINARNKYGSTAYWDAWASEDRDDAVTYFLVSHGAETGGDHASYNINNN